MIFHMSEVSTSVHSIDRTRSPRLRGRRRFRGSSGRLSCWLGRPEFAGFGIRRLVRGSVHLISSSNSFDKVRPRDALYGSLCGVQRLITLRLRGCHDAVVMRPRGRRGISTLASGTRILIWSSWGQSPCRTVDFHRSMARLVICRDSPNRLPLLETSVVGPREDLEITSFLLLQ